MQTLGLSGEAKRSDGLLKSLFWPTVENAWDVDYIERQGFWICVIIGVIKAIASLFLGNPVIMISGLAEALIFLLAAMGVREGNWPASAMIFSIYVLDLGFGAVRGVPPGFLPVVVAAILLSNVRAAFLASRWKPVAEEEDRPMRFNETLRDKFVDILPPRAWPILKIPFFVLASLLLFLSILGAASMTARRPGAAPQQEITQP